MATLDVITLAEAKTALTVQSATNDIEIANYITAVSLRLDNLVGPIVKRTVTDEPHDGGTARLMLKQHPVDSIISVSERAGATVTSIGAENFAATTATDFLLDGSFLWRRSAGSDATWAAGRRNILVTYVAGRFTDTASVDQRFKFAAKETLVHLWRTERGMAGPSGPFNDGAPPVIPAWDVPRAVKQMLANELHGPVLA